MEMTKKARKKRSFKMPTAFTIIILIMLVFIALSWIMYAAGIKTEVWEKNNKGVLVATQKSLQGLGILDIFPAIWHGFVAKAEIIAFILCIGGVLGLMARTKAIDAGIARVVAKLNGKEIIIVPILMIVFGLGGTSYGMWEETVAFFPILIPVFKKAGFGPITAVFVILIGAGAGNLASTINPFATGIAFSSAKDVIGNTDLKAATSQSVMFGTRWVMFAFFQAVAIAFVTWFALRVKKGKIIVTGIDESAVERDFMKNDGDIEFTWKRKLTLTIFILGFVFMILSYLPWTDWVGKSALANADSNYNKGMFWLASTHGQWAQWGQWYLVSVSAAFLMIGFIVFLLNHKDFVEKGESKEETYINTFIDGSKDVLSVCLLIAVASGLGVILEKTLIGPYIANSAKGLGNIGLLGFGVVIFILSLVLSFLLPSTSGFGSAFIPIFASIAAKAFGGNDLHPDAEHIQAYKSALGLIIFAYIFAEGVVNLCSPTSAALMAYTKMSHVPYNVWLKHTWKIIVILLVLSFAMMLIIGGIAQAGHSLF